MKKYLMFSIVVLLIGFYACTNETNTDKDSIPGELADSAVTEVIPKVDIPPLEEPTDKQAFFIINVSAFAEQSEAVTEVKKLREKHEDCNYLWIPDYESLSGKELWAVFLGPYQYSSTCMTALTEYQKENPKAYGVKVHHGKQRMTLHNPLDIRINGEQMYSIIIYSTPEEEEVYAEGGGEDWGWFTNDVSEHFAKHYGDKVYFPYLGELSESLQAKIAEESGAEGFGYILKKGNEYSFTPHDMPDGVISSACAFFGLEYTPPEGY